MNSLVIFPSDGVGLGFVVFVVGSDLPMKSKVNGSLMVIFHD